MTTSTCGLTNPLRVLLGVLCFAVASTAFATDAKTGQLVARLGKIVVDIPAGFSGPQRTFPNEQAEQDVYVSRDSPPVVLQMTLITVPQVPPDLTEENRYGAAEHFLSGGLGMFAEKVRQWSQAPIEKARLGGFLGARAKWTGNLHGFPATGVMYCVVTGKESFTFHTFGSAVDSNASLKSSIRAIEKLRVDAADKSPARIPGK